MILGRMRLALGVIWPALLSAIGCARVLGLDEFSKGRGEETAAADAAPADTAAADARATIPSFSPRSPLFTGEPCESCMQENCGHRVKECAEDAICSAWLADVRARPDPASELFRFVKLLPGATTTWADANWEMATHGVPNEVFRACARINGCAKDQCMDACGLGRDFSCIGDFEYPRSFPSRIDLRGDFSDAQSTMPLGGMRVRACSPQDINCDSVLGTDTSDARGLVEFGVVIPSLQPPMPEFNGYILVDGNPEYMPHVLARTAPILDHSIVGQSMVATRAVTGFFDSFGVVRDPGSGLIYVQPYDCPGHGAKGVTVEAWIADAQTYRKCADDCGVLYANDTGVPDLTRDRISGRAELAFVANVPARQVRIIVRDVETGYIVGVGQLNVRPGFVHSLTVYPPTATQLADVPREAR